MTFDTTTFPAFERRLAAEIEKISADSNALVPENFNVLNFQLAIDQAKIDDDIPFGLMTINGIDYSKVQQAIMHLKTQKQLTRDVVYDIPLFEFSEDGPQEVLGEDDDGTAILASVNSAIIDMRVPNGYDGRRAVVVALKKDSVPANMKPSDWYDWGIEIVRQTKGSSDPYTRTIGMSIYQQQDRIRATLKFESSESVKLTFPGMYVAVRYYRSAL